MVERLVNEEDRKMLFAPKEKGNGLVEYTILLLAAVVLAIAVLSVLGPAIFDLISFLQGCSKYTLV